MIRLSPTAVLKYETCPQQYWLKEVCRLRPVHRAANLVFGTVIHRTMADWLTGWHQDQPPSPVDRFQHHWTDAQQHGIAYSATQSPESLRAIGEALVRLWPTVWPRWDRTLVTDRTGALLLERKLEVRITDTVTFVGRLDVLTRTAAGVLECLDLKTPRTPTDPAWLTVADQLTGYQVLLDAHAPHLGIAPVERLGWVELIKRNVTAKGKGPEVCTPITVARRPPAQTQDYVQKVLWVAEDIARGRFPKRGLMAHNSPCTLCAVRGLCQDGDMEGLIVPETPPSVGAASQTFF